ncbi:MAG TPA: CxxC-x17-CxxC domain-containing protein [Nevskiaceae bacterium]|nr:CxxC-x17-CxxC domain-containing protein [Nevskiaceae bacterium]
MADKDKTVVEEPVEEPKAEEPSDTATPAGDAAVSAGTDQQGRQLYNVTCADCGKQTQVPFKPSGDRPVYCRDCYLQKRGGEAGGGMSRGPRR